MEDKKGFLKSAKEFSKQLKEVVNEGKPIRYLSHYDTDGISSAGIMSLGLNSINANFHLSIIKQVMPDILKEVAKTKPGVVLFSDLGSGHLPLIKKYLNDSKIFILDHHPVAKAKLKDLIQLNPNEFGISGVDCVAAAGVCYFAAKNFIPKEKKLTNLAIVGAMGDRQDKGESFSLISLNEDIANEGKKNGSVKIEEDIRLFGRETRPLHVSLQYTTNPFIPGLSGNNDGTLKFLKKTGITFREGNEWRTLSDLTSSEKKVLVSKLVEHIIRKGGDIKQAKNIVGTI
ncbi:MAG: DHH family phosphoesterase, partial [Candidatus Ranarchaeia archaeon]